MIRRLVSLVLLAMTAAGCSSTYRYAHYDADLVSVTVDGSPLRPGADGSYRDGRFAVSGVFHARHLSIAVTNLTGRTISLVWDKASITRGTGRSSRAIRGQTLILFSDRPQPPDPIPGGGTLEAEVFPERDIELGPPYFLSCSKRNLESRLREVAEAADRGVRVTIPVDGGNRIREVELHFGIHHLVFDTEREPGPP